MFAGGVESATNTVLWMFFRRTRVSTESYGCETIASMSDTQNSSSHGKLIAAVVAAALVVVLALVSAFVWPGWALNNGSQSAQSGQQSSSSTGAKSDDKSGGASNEPTTPSIDAVALPEGASELLKAMPDSVLNFARTKADEGTMWSSASPVEEYTLTYSTGKQAQDVTLEAAQWSDADKAKAQYDSLAKALEGKELASGNVKVSGKNTGSYSVNLDSTDDSKAIAVWQNDTVVFYATGAKNAVHRFYQQFPL